MRDRGDGVRGGCDRRLWSVSDRSRRCGRGNRWGGATYRWVTSRHGGTRGAAVVLAAGLVLGIGTFVPALLRLATPAVSEQVLTRVVLVSIVVASVLVASVDSAGVADASRLDLGIASVSAFESAIGAAFGGNPISVRFPAADGGWIDPAGDFVSIDADQMRIVREGGEGGHVLAALGDSGRLAAGVPVGLLDLLRLAGAQARLQVEVRSRLVELSDSRRRLLDAGDAERRQLERQLRDGALARLATVDLLISGTDGLETLRERVATTRMELDGVARGIDPLAGRCLKTRVGSTGKQQCIRCQRRRPWDRTAHAHRTRGVVHLL